MKFIIYKTFFLIFFLLTENSYSQVNTLWTSLYNGTANDTDEVTSFVVDDAGNVYVTGFSRGSGTGKDFATIKYNSIGIQQWAARYNNTGVNGDDIATAIAADGSGNIYVTGYSSGTFKDYVTIKYSSSGSQLWLSRFNGKGNDDDIAYSISVDEKENVYVTGSSVGKITSENYATIKYDSKGIEQWVVMYNNDLTDDIDISNSIALDNNGNVYVTGYSVGNATQEDYATIKYNSDGDEIWVARYNGPDNEYDISSGIRVDNSGNVYVTGFSFSKATAEDYATIKYNSSGNQEWLAVYNGQDNSYDISTSIDIDNSGNVYITGYSFADETSEDYATIKYNASGIEQWVSRYDGKGGDYDIATKIKVDKSGNSYVTGFSYGTGAKEDFATIRYDSNGDEVWSKIFNGKPNGSDIAASLFVDEAGNVYVTGYSYGGATSIDYVTIKYSQTVGISQIMNSIPAEFKLEQNYPNPFNPNSIINYEIPITSYVELKVYNILGNEIATLVNEKQNAGSYSYQLSTVNYQLSSGTYFYKLTADGVVIDTKRMVLLK